MRENFTKTIAFFKKCGPRGEVIIQANDVVVLGAEVYEKDESIKLKEIVLQKENPWVGMRIRDLDISRQSIIVLVKRRNKSLIPNGNMILHIGDNIFLYSQMHLADAIDIDV